jgi:hypothetical protein
MIFARSQFRFPALARQPVAQGPANDVPSWLRAER